MTQDRHSSRSLHVTLVRQKEANGCIVAALAMLTGKSYDEVRADHIFSGLAEEAKGCSFREVEEYLFRHGLAWQEVYRCGPPGNTMKSVWPPEPWADAHICEVQTGQAHAVVLLRDGTVLDPLHDEPKRLTDYAQVYSVRAVYSVAPSETGPLEFDKCPDGKSCRQPTTGCLKGQCRARGCPCFITGGPCPIHP